MTDKHGTEASGLPLIAAEYARNADPDQNLGHIAINVDDGLLNPQKSTFSEEQLKLAELEKANMSTARKRGGMKVAFGVSKDRFMWAREELDGCIWPFSNL